MTSEGNFNIGPPGDDSSLISEWDVVGPLRDDDLAAGRDESFEYVLKPWILERVMQCQRLLDAGCGTGRLSVDLWTRANHVTGIDPSAKSIRMARTHDFRTDYHIATLTEWADRSIDHANKYDAIIANMVLMDVPDLDEFLRSAYSLLEGGTFIATFTHPFSWPKYWGYHKDPNFTYLSELAINTSFRTRSQVYDFPTTHIHRPMQSYINAFIRAGFVIEEMCEIRGTEEVQEFPYPRFVGIVARDAMKFD